MSYSDFDSDGYSSAQDEDYLPSDENLSEDDINECEKEEPLHEDDDVPHPDDTTKKKRKDARSRKKRSQKLKKTEDEEAETKEAQSSQQEDHNADEETRQKKKSDDLWASFLSDVGSRPKHCQLDPTQQAAASSELKVPAASKGTKPSGPTTVTITKVFDFAGEEVRVHKEVLADSKEARSFLKSQSTEQEEDGDDQESSSPCQPTLPGPSSKRPAGMSSVLSRIGGKKQKMSTLEKSKMDWDAFKSEEGITDELAIHNRGKDGYVERKNFLERVDHRQFEREKAVRLSNMKL